MYAIQRRKPVPTCRVGLVYLVVKVTKPTASKLDYIETSLKTSLFRSYLCVRNITQVDIRVFGIVDSLAFYCTTLGALELTCFNFRPNNLGNGLLLLKPLQRHLQAEDRQINP